MDNDETPPAAPSTSAEETLPRSRQSSQCSQEGSVPVADNVHGDKQESIGVSEEVRERTSSSASATSASGAGGGATGGAAAGASVSDGPGSGASSTASTPTLSAKKSKIDIVLKPVGDAPILKQKRWSVDPDKEVGTIIQFIKKYLNLGPENSLFVFVNQAFAPSPDQIIRNLYDCFGSDGKLILHYSKTVAWG